MYEVSISDSTLEAGMMLPLNPLSVQVLRVHRFTGLQVLQVPCQSMNFISLHFNFAFELHTSVSLTNLKLKG
jgi:hypothetical protein